MKRTVAFALLVLVLALGGVDRAGAQEAYVIGATGAMTGPAAANFAPVLEAMKAYLDNLNGRGGVNGKPVQMLVLDDSGEPSKAAANAKKLIAQDRVLMLVSSSPSSTYAPLVVESRRAGVPLYYAGAVCPKETYPPADPLQFCSTAYGATLDSQAALAFVKAQATEPVRIGFATMAIPIARAEIEYAEGLARTLGMTAVDTQITPPPVPDYTPFATKLKDANPNWVYSWSPWVSQVRTFEALRRLGWNGRYITWAHLNAEEELARLKDASLYVVGTNAFFQDNLPIHAEIRATTQKAGLKYPATYLAEGFIAGLVAESVLKNTAWPPTPAKVLAAMNGVKVDLKGLRGGPLEWTADNHFRTTQHYRVWHWDAARQAIVQIQDWQAIPVKR